MTNSINQPWAISDDFRTRYGNTWADLDFVVESKISAENFKTDPMNCTIGHLNIFNQKIYMRYKDLISYSKSVSTFAGNVYANRPGKEETFPVEIKGQTLVLRKHEIGKLAQTLSDALEVSMRSYELGLYL
jgi:hypothetical protein